MTNDKQKDRLVELIGSKVCEEYSPNCDEYEPHTCEKCYANFCKVGDLADAIISDGWMRPPCKVGDKVYFVFEGDVLSDEITLIEVTESEMYLSTCSERYMLINGYLYSEMLDEKAYFTKEEAEQALQKGR